MRTRFLLLIFFSLLLGGSEASAKAGPSRTVVTGSARLAAEISQVLQAVPGAQVGIYVKSMKHGDTLYAQNINRSFVPASVLKILTAETALLYLGPDYRFTTQLVTDAKSIEDGMLTGNLYLIHSGDPSLTYDDLNELMGSLKDQQITSIKGNVYIDDSAFDQSYGAPGWARKDAQYCYAAPISAGIVNHNCLAFRITPAAKIGQLAHIQTSPGFYYPAMHNTIVTKARSKRGCALKLTGYSDSMISLNGCMPKGHLAWGVSYVIENVLTYNQSLVKSLVKKYGVQVRGYVLPGHATPELAAVGDHRSKPLKLIINDMLKKSDNVIAGALFKKIGQTYSRQPGSWTNGGAAMQKILADKMHINIHGLHVVDGSGLSRYNQITPLQMMQVLDFAYHNYATNYEFVSALPISGTDGTLKHRMYNIARRVRAKTGTIKGVVSLAGYATSANREPLAFVIMINDRPGSGWVAKDVEDKIATLLTQYQRSGPA